MGLEILPSDLQALVRYALQEPARLSPSNFRLLSAENGGGSPGRSERLKALIDGIHFSKNFILSYQLVLVALLLVFIVIHWTSRLQAWRRRRRRDQSIERKTDTRVRNSVEEALKGEGGIDVHSRGSGSSSSSSTLRVDLATDNTTLERPDERTSLLSKPRLEQATTSRSLLIGRIKSWLVYQPRPIPIINKTLPSNGASLAIMAFIGLQIFYTFYKTPLSISMLFVFADRTALLFVANLPLLYLFAAKNQPLKVLTGYSYESLNIVHRRLGEIMCLLALLHSAGMIGVWYTILRPSGVTLVRFLLLKIILLGIGAFVAYEMIYFTSLGSFRQKWYELFLGLHVVLQAAALILVWFHHSGSRPYVGVALAIFLIDRVVYRMAVKTSTVIASLEVMKDGKTVALRTSLPIGGERSFLSYLWGSTNITGAWKATEHVFLTVPSLAHKHVIQAHPFTIASRAPNLNDKDAKLELVIRAQDGFSADLLRFAEGHHAVAIRLDGPYGSQSAVRMLQDSDHAIIVAGGSGIAVAWPLVCSVMEAYRKDDLEQLDDMTNARRILFVWIVREQSHLSWLGHDRLQRLAPKGVTVEIPPPTAECGHPDIHGLITDWTTSLGGRIGVVASGPDGLNRSVRNTCASLLWQGQNVNVEIEKFGW